LHDAGGADGLRAEAESGAVKSLFERSSLTTKLNLAVFGNTIVLALVAAALLLGTFHLGQGGQAQALVASIEVRSNNAALALVDAIEALERAGEGDPQAAGRATAALDRADAMLGDPIEFAGDRMPADVGPTIVGFRDQVRTLGEQVRAARGDTARLTALEGEARDLYRSLSGFALAYHEPAARSADRLFASISTFLFGFVVLFVVGVALSLLGARTIILNVVGSVRTITRAMQELAEGRTSVAIPGRERSDELGDMARALTVFQTSSLALRDLTADRARDAERQLVRQQELNAEAQALRDEQSGVLSELARGFRISVGEVIASVKASADAMRASSKDMVLLASSSVAQSTEAAGAMQAATRNITAAAAAADQFALSIAEISRQATASATLARDAGDLVRSANTKMSDLNEAAHEIGEIAGLIQSIAQRTNLLALNASIEAARGGEAGRGFAVVASEVKELANQTSLATSSVAEKIAAMQSSTHASAGDLNSIVDQIARLEEASVAIASAVDEQSLSGEELSRNIDTVAAGAQHVSERLVALSEASRETGDAAGNVLASAEALGGHADGLQERAGRFVSDVQRASLEIAAQGDDATELRRATARLARATDPR
jgi:methyl-accepting chemotaxis protein